MKLIHCFHFKALLALCLLLSHSSLCGASGPIYAQNLSADDQHYALNNTQLAQFEQDGYIVIEDLFSADEVAALDAAAKSLFREVRAVFMGAPNLPGTRVDFKGSSVLIDGDQNGFPIVKLISWAAAARFELLAYGHSPEITVPMAQLLGCTEADNLINQVHYKTPEDGIQFPWHQDIQHRMKFDPNWTDVNGRGSFVQCFIAIDACTQDNGALKIVPLCGDPTVYNLGDKTQEERDACVAQLLAARGLKEPITLLLNPGDAIFFHPKLVHCSGPSTAKAPKKAFLSSFSYPGANTKPYPGEGSAQRVVLVHPQ